QALQPLAEMSLASLRKSGSAKRLAAIAGLIWQLGQHLPDPFDMGGDARSQRCEDFDALRRGKRFQLRRRVLSGFPLFILAAAEGGSVGLAAQQPVSDATEGFRQGGDAGKLPFFAVLDLERFQALLGLFRFQHRLSLLPAPPGAGMSLCYR